MAQMAAEAGPSTSGVEEPARRKLLPTVGGKAPPEGIPPGWKVEGVKKTRKYWPGTVAL